MRLGSEGEARARVFLAIFAANLALILVSLSRSERFARIMVKPNRIYWLIAALTCIALGIAVYWPSAAAIFQFAQPSLAAVLAVIVAAVSLVLASGVLLRNR